MEIGLAVAIVSFGSCSGVQVCPMAKALANLLKALFTSFAFAAAEVDLTTKAPVSSAALKHKNASTDFTMVDLFDSCFIKHTPTLSLRWLSLGSLGTRL